MLKANGQVLPILTPRPAVENIDANTLTESGIYICTTGCSSLPKSIGDWTTLFVIPVKTPGGNLDYVIQLAISVTTGKTAVRRSFRGDWTDWKPIKA